MEWTEHGIKWMKLSRRRKKSMRDQRPERVENGKRGKVMFSVWVQKDGKWDRAELGPSLEEDLGCEEAKSGGKTRAQIMAQSEEKQ